jgi:hypothetical protein
VVALAAALLLPRAPFGQGDVLVAVSLNQTTLRPGETVTVGFSASVPPGAPPANLYLVIAAPGLWPDGNTLFVVTGSGLGRVRLSELNALAPLMTDLGSQAGLSIGNPAQVSHTFTGSEPRGAYSVLAVLARPGWNADGRVDPGDVIALDHRVFEFGPAPIAIPSGVFIALERPVAGLGPDGGTKHSTYAHNPIDGRLYQLGGDFKGPFGEASYRQDMYSVSIAERWRDRANRNAGWRLEYPFCGPAGGVQPKYPDFVGWTWDSRRNVFWTVPGQYEVNRESVCPGETADRVDDPGFKWGHLMTFNPFEPDLARRWADVEPHANRGPFATETWQTVYDPQPDQLVRLGYDAGSGQAVVAIYDIRSRTWTSQGLGLNALGQDIRVWKEGKTADLDGRAVYTIDGFAGRLHRYDLDARTLSDLGPVPGGQIAGGTTTNDAYVAWDSVNHVLFFFRIDTRTLHVYQPATGVWESPPIRVDWSNVPAPAPDGMPHVRHALVFDPHQNVLVLLGTTDPANPYMYLYRYAPPG